MKKFKLLRNQRSAFTLIELLIVVAIIAIVAALLFPTITGIASNRVKNVAYGELNQITTAIEAYKAKKGFYPPAGNLTNATLYYELVGTTNNGQTYLTLDGRDFPTGIMTNLIASTFGVGGFANSGVSAQGSDDGQAPQTFLKEVKQLQVGSVGAARVLVCSDGGVAGGRWRYNPINPTHNPGSYDLWLDIVLKGKTNRISNWSKQPEKL